MPHLLENCIFLSNNSAGSFEQVGYSVDGVEVLPVREELIHLISLARRKSHVDCLQEGLEIDALSDVDAVDVVGRFAS